MQKVMPTGERTICDRCGTMGIKKTRIAEYETQMFGPKMKLIKAAVEYSCENCGDVLVEIPNHKGLIAAAALSRIALSLKLRGTEIRFVRKALGVSAKKLAQVMEVTPETVSRWENDKQVMSPSKEKYLRVWAGVMLEDNAPAVAIDFKEIFNMKINSVRDADKKLVMEFVLVTGELEGRYAQAAA